jgi:hypothetical protein
MSIIGLFLENTPKVSNCWSRYTGYPGLRFFVVSRVERKTPFLEGKTLSIDCMACPLQAQGRCNKGAIRRRGLLPIILHLH